MGPNTDRQPDLHTSPDLTELGIGSPDLDPSSRSLPSSPESLPGGELKPKTTPIALPKSEPVSTNPIVLSNTPSPVAQTPLQNDNPHVAEDNDLIEKDWVVKAKAIVAKTRHDPYLESKEINHFKADYLKKRYNKVLKVAEE